jgi:PAS domain S-box-containing protein
MTDLPTEERNLRILIVDDNTAIHADVRKILGAPAEEDSALDREAAELFGLKSTETTTTAFEIDSAFQGQEGLEMVQSAHAEGRPYAMAFIDVRMPPGWDGIETIQRIWKEHPDLQVVICTAYSDYSWEEMIRKVGNTDKLVILKKPFDNIEVLQLAHTLTQKWTLSHRLQCHLAGLDLIVAKRTRELQEANDRLRGEMQDREQAEHDLRQSETRFSKAFNASPIPLTIQCLKTERFIDVNDAFLALIGFRRLEVMGRTPAELDLCPASEVQSDLFQRLRTERSLRDFECQLKQRGGAPRDCVVSAEAFELGSDMVTLIATQDVSEQRRLEKELRHAQKLEAVGQFAAGVAHDFNNLLTVIQGHASIQLAAKDLEKDLENSLAQVSHAAERAAALTRQILAFSRKQIVQFRLLDLNAVVHNLEDMLRRLVDTHIDLQCEFSEVTPWIYSDQGNVEQIIVNLVVNARDAMPDGGKLHISTAVIDIDERLVQAHPQAQPGAHARLTVRDNGMGMSPDTLGHIFEPFFTTKDAGKGTGLGLATVHGIVAQQRGWVEVETAPGAGAAFQVYLPLSEAATAPLSPHAESAAYGGHETVLVVEDEEAVRQIMTSVLIQHGYRIFEAADGPEALLLWAQKSDEIDIVVTDIVMPNGIRGNILAQRLQAERPDLKVIFSSGYSSEFATQDKPLASQFTFLQKPYKPLALVKAVREALDSTRGLAAAS